MIFMVYVMRLKGIEDVNNGPWLAASHWQDGKIKFIRSPQEGEFGVEMLRLLAKEDEEEMRIAPD